MAIKQRPNDKDVDEQLSYVSYNSEMTVLLLKRADPERAAINLNKENELLKQKWRDGVQEQTLYECLLVEKVIDAINTNLQLKEMLRPVLDDPLIKREASERVHIELLQHSIHGTDALSWQMHLPKPGKEPEHETLRKEKEIIRIILDDISQYAIRRMKMDKRP